MSVLNSSLLLGADAGAAGYQIQRSLRFNAPDASFLSRTPASAGNRKTWTWAGWVKRSTLGNQAIVDVLDGQAGQPRGGIYFSSDDSLQITFNSSGTSWDSNVITTAVFRDVSAWYHLLIALDVTQSTASDRVKVYINGVQLTAFSTATYPANTNQPVNNTVQHRIGLLYGGTLGLNGYLADVHFIDGQALDPSAFVAVSATTGQLIPKAYSGSYGTNGFHLDFADNSTTAALGTDTSGNGNTWTVNNISILTGGPTSVASASGALPILNTNDTYGTIASGGIRSDSLAANIQLCLPFNGGSTTDVSPTGRVSSPRTGTVSNVSSNSISKFYGSSARFASGSINYGIVSAAAVNSTNNHTFEGWFRVDDVTLTRALFSWYNYENGWVEQGWQIRIASSKVSVRNATAGNEIFSKSIASNTWYHFAVTFQGVACKLYLDGELQSSTSNFGTPGNTSNRLTVGSSFYYGSVQDPITGYLQDFRWYDYVKYTTSFNPPSATINGGIAAGNDSLTDTPSSYGTDTGAGGEVRGNYCTWNPLARPRNALPTFSNGNVQLGANTTNGTVLATMAVSSGKWYWEVTVDTVADALIGATAIDAALGSSQPGYISNSAAYLRDGRVKNNGSDVGTYATYTNGDIIGLALDMDAKTLAFYKNNTLIVTLSSSISGTWIPAVTDFNTGGAALTANFGQRPFAYTAPSGFKALCDTNLPAPVVAKPNTVFDVVTYTGNGSARSITLPGGFSPDLIWTKSRSAAYFHHLYDIVRGTNSDLSSNSTTNELTGSPYNDGVTAFNSNGYSLGTFNGLNENGTTYVAWTWDAGSSTVTNTQGSITSQVRANPSAGFSIVTWTGSGAVGTIGHGLGAAPGMIIVKARSATELWYVYHTSLGPSQRIQLNETSAAVNSVVWNSTSPTSTVFSITNNLPNTSGVTYVAYCFAPVNSYSAFGSYQGNGSADGPFVYTGFRPRWIMFKATYLGANTDWTIWDTARDAFNVTSNYIRPNLSSAEQSIGYGDILSNGFKFRYTDGNNNASGQTYIYAAFAESPFQYSRAR